jgi:hypothetical protein
MGKTELLLRLQGWVDGDEDVCSQWGPPPIHRSVWSSYRNLRDPWDVDQLLMMLRATAAAADIRPRAFDVGLLARWTSAHPGEDLPRVEHATVDPQGLIRGVATAALTAIGVPVVAGWLAGVLTDRAWGALSERSREGTIAACADLMPVLRAVAQKPDEMTASSIAMLLDWDLRTLPPPERPTWVVFLDGYEEVQRRRPEVDELVRRLVFATPHVLWVLAGRSPLNWAGSGSSAAFGGVDRWPELAPGAPDSAQHLLGELAPEDADTYLRKVLTDEHGKALLDEATRKQIISNSKGWPLYLDFAHQHALNLLAGGTPLKPDCFTGRLEGLVERVAADLPSDEREVLNACALVRTFDPELVAVGADNASAQGAADRLIQRPIVSPSPDQVNHHQLHDVVRDIVRDAPPTVRGAWASNDWTGAGRRMLELLHRRSKAAIDAPSRLEVNLAAFDIAAELDLRVDWLLPALLQHPLRAALAQQVVGRGGRRANPDGWTASVEGLLACWLPSDPESDIVDRLTAFARTAGVADDVRRRALRSRGYRLRTLTRHAEAEAQFAELRREADGPLLWFQHGLTMVHLGRFADAEALHKRLAAEGRTSMADRLIGELSLQHGHVHAAASATGRRLAHAEAGHDFHNAMELRVTEARHIALSDPSRLSRVDEAIAMTSDHLAVGYLRSALCSKAICLAADDGAVADLIAQSEEWARAVGAPEVTVHEALACTFSAAVRQDPAAMIKARRMMASSERARDLRWRRPLTWWQEVTLGEPLSSFAHEVQWLEPEDEVRERWVDLTRRRG